MKTATTAEYRRVLAMGLVCLGLTAIEGRAFADQPECPDCPYLNATIEFDTTNDEFVLEVEEYANFDSGDFDGVELMLVEGMATEYVDLNFEIEDLDNPIWEQHDTPSRIPGVSPTVYLRFFIIDTSDEYLVPVTVE